MDDVGYWMYKLLVTHMAVNTFEKENKYAGMRTVISGGVRLIHNYDTITFDDLVSNYTKEDPNGPSSIKKAGLDYTILSNPEFLQMNTAFSRSYILDGMGSKYGISGANIYIDETVFDTLKQINDKFGKSGNEIIQEDIDGLYVFAIRKYENRYNLGFEMDPDPINIDSNGINTIVYRLVNYYTWDESPSDFKLCVNDF